METYLFITDVIDIFCTLEYIITLYSGVKYMVQFYTFTTSAYTHIFICREFHLDYVTFMITFITQKHVEHD